MMVRFKSRPRVVQEFGWVSGWVSGWSGPRVVHRNSRTSPKIYMDFSEICSGFSRTSPVFLQGLKNRFFTNFLRCKNQLFTKIKAGNSGITSETTQESRVRRPGLFLKLKKRIFTEIGLASLKLELDAALREAESWEGSWKPFT